MFWSWSDESEDAAAQHEFPVAGPGASAFRFNRRIIIARNIPREDLAHHLPGWCSRHFLIEGLRYVLRLALDINFRHPSRALSAFSLFHAR